MFTFVSPHSLSVTACIWSTPRTCAKYADGCSPETAHRNISTRPSDAVSGAVTGEWRWLVELPPHELALSDLECHQMPGAGKP